jgi:hypothetical protein
MPIISATREAEIRRIMIQSQPRERVTENPISKIPTQNRAGGVCLPSKCEGPKFKPVSHPFPRPSQKKKIDPQKV